MSVCGCLSRLSLCGPVMDWRPVQGVPRLSPEDCWDRLQPPRDPTEGLSGRKWMDGWGCTVVWWLAPSPHSERVPGLIPTWGLSVWSLHVLPVYAWVLSGYSGFLPPFKNMHVRLIGDSKKIVLRSECECVWLFVSFISVWSCDGLATGPGCTLPLTR